MTIHRIVRDDRYLIFDIPHLEVLEKLGRGYPIHIKRSPVKYSEVWKEPLRLDFGPEEETIYEEIPDLSVYDGRMFFSVKAFQALGDELRQDGEFLPVTYAGGSGYLFNPLTIAENFGARDDRLTVLNEFDEAQSIGFIENKLPVGTMIFRSTISAYYDVFCTDELRLAVERAGLTGVIFHPDLADISGGATTEH